MNKHTLGPWQVHPTSTTKIFSCGVDPLRLVATAEGDHFEDREQCEANARLIAAAPDLLEALRDLTDLAEHAGWIRRSGDCIDRARAAIAKATANDPL